MKVSKAFITTFEATQGRVKIKIYVNISPMSGIETGRVKKFKRFHETLHGHHFRKGQ